MAKKTTKKTATPRSKIYGFVLHFGYVESSRVSNVILHSGGRRFTSLHAAVTDLTMFFLNDFLEGCVSSQESWDKYNQTTFLKGTPRPEDPTLDEFRRWLYDRPTTVASAGPGDVSWDQNNTESWWPWDQLHEIYPVLHQFYENVEGEGADTILLRFIDPSRVSVANYVSAEALYPSFFEEVRDEQTPPTDAGEFRLDLWKKIGDLRKQFKPVARRASSPSSRKKKPVW